MRGEGGRENGKGEWNGKGTPKEGIFHVLMIFFYPVDVIGYLGFGESSF